MVELAGRLPLSKLERMLQPSLPDEDRLALCQAMLLGTAGLLPSQRGCPATGRWVKRLETIWYCYGKMPTMAANDWQSFKVRPGNLPVRRLAAAAYLLWRYRRPGMLAGLMGLLGGWSGGPPRGLEDGLVVAAEGPWATELDFGLPMGGDAPALLGNGRAAEIIINVLLPFAAAWGAGPLLPALAGKARELYRVYPRLAENTLERHMRRQVGLDRAGVDSARRQQGLLHIFKTLCSRGGCGECELKDKGSGLRVEGF
jgi:hypothetical protein